MPRNKITAQKGKTDAKKTTDSPFSAGREEVQYISPARHTEGANRISLINTNDDHGKRFETWGGGNKKRARDEYMRLRWNSTNIFSHVFGRTPPPAGRCPDEKKGKKKPLTAVVEFPPHAEFPSHCVPSRMTIPISGGARE
jgi:hypothetical protein